MARKWPGVVIAHTGRTILLNTEQHHSMMANSQGTGGATNPKQGTVLQTNSGGATMQRQGNFAGFLQHF